MTKAQEEAKEKIEMIMREHFDAGVFMATVSDENGISDIIGTWHGGYVTAHGLLKLGPDYMENAEKER